MKFQSLFLFFSTHSLSLHTPTYFQCYFSLKHLQSVMGNSVVAFPWKETFESLLTKAIWELSDIQFQKRFHTQQMLLSSLLIKGTHEENCVLFLSAGKKNNHEIAITIKKLHSQDCLPGTINRSHAENNSFSEIFHHERRASLIGTNSASSSMAKLWQCLKLRVYEITE